MKHLLPLFLALLIFVPSPVYSQKQAQIPGYINQGLTDYQNKGYETAVHPWLAGSPFAAGSALVSRITFFKNIEMMYGSYLGHDIVFVKQTASSSQVYVRMNYERTAGYIMFTSILRHGNWVLGNIELDRLQKYGSTVGK